MLWLANSFYARTLFFELIQSKADDNFIFSFKGGSHKFLYDLVYEMDAIKRENTIHNGNNILYYH